jgi:Ca2+-binding EF-hand superfamily protein
MRRTHGMLLLLAGMLILPNFTWSQGGGKIRNKGEKMAADPDAAFNALSNGKEIIVVSELSPDQQMKLKFAASRLGFEFSEKITREQFKDSVSMFKKAPPGGGPDGPGGKGPPQGKGGPGGSREDRATALFRRYDRNGDGVLSHDEVPEALEQYFEKFDTDKSATISENEFKEFYNAMWSNGREPPANPAGDKAADPTRKEQVAKPAHEENKPTVYRAGKLPKGLPEWFTKLDNEGDQDGQVALWEARNDKSVLDNFAKMDLNGDGLLTAEEVLRYMAKQKKPPADSTVATSATADAGAAPAPFAGRGGFPQGGFPQGGGFRAMFAPNADGQPGDAAQPAPGGPKMGWGQGQGEKGGGGRSRGPGGGNRPPSNKN